MIDFYNNLENKFIVILIKFIYIYCVINVWNNVLGKIVIIFIRIGIIIVEYYYSWVC